MEGDFIKINEWLLPLSWIYGFGVGVRNWLFDIGLKRQRSYSLPIISVGNLTVGGCGKTPHVEYLVELLKDNNKVAVLSRGYKRKSSEFVLAGNDTPMPEIGDEPYQMKHKFPDITVAVDKKRCHGIDMMLKNESTKDIDVVLLDDAFQHRYIKPGLNILLVDYHRLIIYDKLLPAGRLREPKSGKERADIVIVTKCPDMLKPMDYRVLTKAMNLRPYQKLYFTSIAYKALEKAFDRTCKRELSSLRSEENILLFSGIASPEQLIADISAYNKNITPLTFADHHQFSANDLKHIQSAFEALPEPKVIITTEKDAARLEHLESIPDVIKDSLYIMPITVNFNLEQQDSFNERITSFVHKTKAMHKMQTSK